MILVEKSQSNSQNVPFIGDSQLFHNSQFFQNFRTHSQHIKKESWKTEKTKLPESFCVNSSHIKPNIHQSFNIKFVAHGEINVYLV